MATKLDKYLTDMKELPPVMEETDKNTPEEEPKKAVREIKKEEEHMQISTDIESKKNESNNLEEFSYKDKSEIKTFTTRDMILGIMNILSIGVLIFILIKFPGKSQDLKKERTQMLLNDAGFSFELSEVGQAKAKADEINKVFVDESGIVDFVNDLEKIKSKNGVIKKITFTSQKALEDRQTGNYGIPVVIDFVGSTDKVLADLDEIQKLPYLLRAITVQTEINDEDPGMLNFKYGGFLYVNDSLGQSR